MAGNPLAKYPPDVGSGPAEVFEEYLAAITRRLPGPRSSRKEAIAELRDGLCDTFAHNRRRGLTGAEAARQTIDEFGPVSVVADAYTDVLADLQARRTSQILVFTGPIIGLLWLLTLAPGQTPDAVLLTMPPLAILVPAGALAAIIALAATGRVAHLLPDTPRLPQRAAVTACIIAGAIDLAVLTFAVDRALTDPPGLPLLLVFAGLASLTRIAYSQHAAHTNLKTRPAHH
jgi:hypothetical protein